MARLGAPVFGLQESPIFKVQSKLGECLMDGATELVEGFLKNLLMNSNTSKINLIPTNGSKSFFKTDKIFTGPSDFHKLALSIFKTTFAKSKPDEIVFRNYRKCNENNFNVDLRNQLSSEQPKDYTSFEKIFFQF